MADGALPLKEHPPGTNATKKSILMLRTTMGTSSSSSSFIYNFFNLFDEIFSKNFYSCLQLRSRTDF